MAQTASGDSVARRDFLKQIGAIAAASSLAAGGGEARAVDVPATQPLPTIALGKYQISRLVAGWNPIGGHSYLGPHMDQHMKEYFTVDQTVEFLLDCERAGINTHQFSASDKTAPILRQVREAGSHMQFIGLHAGRDAVAAFIAETEPIALVHHGGVTDRLFRENKQQEVHDYVKQVHDAGLLAGVSAHNPACIRQIAEENWEVDFFMCCFYYLTRPMTDEQGNALQPATLQIAYPFYRDDPNTMTHVMRQIRQPCLGFKILGAGRQCANQAMVRSAFQFAFQNIKPTDGVIVGMYPRFFDEITADAGYTRECAAPGVAG